jgi:YhcH/YjgK/YiaL family protein
MITDKLQRIERYLSVHPGFRAGAEFLRRPDLRQLPPGRHEIDGRRLFAMVALDQGRGREKSLLEFHRKYIDIQFLVAGADVIGWRPTELCNRIATPYDAEKDVGLFYDRPETWLEVPADYFAILFPDDAHAPLANTGNVHKVVVKVAIDW